MRRRYAKDPTVDKSLRHSVRDGVAYAVMTGGGETYFSAFAIYLKATVGQVGMLAALPPLLGSLAQLVSAWLGRRIGNRKKIILAGAAVQAFSWVPLALLPAVFPDYAVPLLIASIVLYYTGSNLAAPQWSSLMGDLVPERRRGRFFGLRTRFSSMTAFIALVSAGVILHLFDSHGATLYGYWTIFAIAAIARLVSIYHLIRMHDPPGHVAALELPSRGEWWRRLRSSTFVRFSVFYALMQMAVAISSPFFTVYMLRDLHYSYVQFTANTAVVVVMQFITLNWWGRIGDAFGNRVILATTGMVIPCLPALWLVSTDSLYLIGVQVLGGLAWAGFSLSAANFLYDLIPRDKRATFLAVHSVMTSCGVFAGALIGGYLASVLPREFTWQGETYQWLSALYGVFLISTVARVTIALLFLPRLKEVRDVRPMSVGGLVFRVTRFNALAGLFFDVIGAKRR